MRARGPERGIPYELHGDLSTGLSRILPGAAVTGVALEFGTFDLERMVELLIADCWVHNFGDPRTPPGDRIRQQLLDFFYPSTPEWIRSVRTRSLQVIRAFQDGLARAAAGPS